MPGGFHQRQTRLCCRNLFDHFQPSDLVVDKRHRIYFTDPRHAVIPFGPAIFPFLDHCSVLRLERNDRRAWVATRITYYTVSPRTVLLSPDEKTLYVANSDPKKAIWMSFPINEDGTLGKGKVFADYTSTVGKKGKTADGEPAMQLPDGMKVDVKGNLWATGPGGLLVFTPAGKHIGTLATGVNTGNCCFGDDGSTLYVMCDKAIGRIKTKTKGWGF